MGKFREQNMLFTKALISLMLIFSCLFSIFMFIPNAAYAENTTYSNVLDDLHKDENFNEEDYPLIVDDYSLQVIQIAESEDNELFVYVYQPSGPDKDLRATSINISTAINNSFSPINYKLIFLNSNDVFYKYKVENFEILEDALRYYSIVSIFRQYIEGVDEPASGDNVVEEISYEVGKLYTATTIDGKVTYTCKTTETILITDKFVGYIRYYNGFTLYNKYCDSHYIAFSTDKPMDRLMEVEVYFEHRDVTTRINLTGEHPYSKGEIVEEQVKLSEIDKGHSSAHGWFATKYEWQRIEKISDFIADKDNNLTNETKEELTGKQWVVRFYETDVHENSISGVSYRNSVEVSNVTILRLKFETDGIIYNLGVVDNKQTGSDKPSNNITTLWDKIVNWFESLAEWLQIFLIVVLVLIGISFATVILYILWKIVSFPYKLISKNKGEK